MAVALISPPETGQLVRVRSRRWVVNEVHADDVALGKAIESGLVALQLVIRHSARRILVVRPASLQVQWREQMRDRFGFAEPKPRIVPFAVTRLVPARMAREAR